MKSTIKFSISAIIFALAFGSCRKDNIGILNIGNFTDTASSTLKDATDIPMGAAVTIGLMKSNPTYAAITKTQFDGITFGNELNCI